MKKILTLTSTLFIAFSICSCNKSKPILKNNKIHHDLEFGGAYIDISIDSFNKLGFNFGDSIDISFSNGVSYNDIGYYSGYYVPAGMELLVGYPGYDYIKFCINYGDDIYTDHQMDESTLATITVNQAGKYKDIEDTLSISYSDDINQYTSREEFANFRNIDVGNVKANMLYRGASPIDNRRKRASTVDTLLKEHNIAYVLDLADKRETVDSFYSNKDFASPTFKSLDENNKVNLLGMAAAYKADDFSNKVKNMFLSMLDNDGPYYIHCLEGKDRTGFICMVIEAMCGATYEELVDDYFITYKNYYGIEKGSSKYETIKSLHIDEMIRYVFGFNKEVKLLGANYLSKANEYLLSIGLTQENINTITDKLTND